MRATQLTDAAQTSVSQPLLLPREPRQFCVVMGDKGDSGGGASCRNGNDTHPLDHPTNRPKPAVLLWPCIRVSGPVVLTRESCAVLGLRIVSGVVLGSMAAILVSRRSISTACHGMGLPATASTHDYFRVTNSSAAVG